jgi:hypothetical protein
VLRRHPQHKFQVEGVQLCERKRRIIWIWKSTAIYFTPIHESDGFLQCSESAIMVN